MKLLTHLAVLFYVTIILFVGCFMLLFVLNLLDFSYLVNVLRIAYTDHNLRIILGIVALVLLLKNFIYAQAISDRKQREKTIAFDNPSGRVTVSLMAMEDLVRRVVLRSPEVKEIKTNIIATKRGLDVSTQLTLKSDVNIPDVTANLQEAIRRKIQDTIGLEEPVNVRMHVMKITTDDIKTKSFEKTTPERSMPFQGYRA
ncbi:MAG: hypothetical protein A2787_08325 [Omnitrophica WOR_2 bacterium RIFCSPHIGHO2_01_FULL_48_9]|nr:MAG: hypothetical protein A3D10_07995 [Omnitrophica WOR_2 bacterium RIFCSPHIGHO2_02_FULL_48_11]OGX33349.1 MAG: hypothetical protein A2787_08325 [Omnitrophica WOR_2 bacterium RIFCSPHIGHO2_01_FULL_48_9]